MQRMWMVYCFLTLAGVVIFVASLIVPLPVIAAPAGRQELTIISVGGEMIEGRAVITGRARNNSPRQYSYANISFAIYNKAGEQIGTANDTVINLDSGATWRFRARAPMRRGAARFRLAKISTIVAR